MRGILDASITIACTVPRYPKICYISRQLYANPSHISSAIIDCCVVFVISMPINLSFIIV